MASGTVNLSTGNDKLTLSSTGSNTLTMTAVETLVGGDFDDTITFGAAVTGSVDLGAGSDSLTLFNGTNSVTITNVEAIAGGTGNDTVTLGNVWTTGAIDLGGGAADKITLSSAGGNIVTLSNIETIVGGSLDDAVTLGAAQTTGSVSLGTGADSLTLFNGTNTLTVTAAETITGGSGADTHHAGRGAIRRLHRPRRRRGQAHPVQRHQQPDVLQCRDHRRRHRQRHRRARHRHGVAARSISTAAPTS